MPSRPPRPFFLLVILAYGLLFDVSNAVAQRPENSKAEKQHSRFAVTIRTFVGQNANPEAEHRILFDNGVVYDLTKLNPAIITVYDPAQGRVTLMDRPTQVQSTIGTEDLVKITAQARAAADGSPSIKKQLGLDATVKNSDQMIGHSISFSGATYHTSVQKPKAALMATEFGQFWDLASRLNLVRRHGLPPFARMTLNDLMTAAGEMPLETTLTVQRGNQSEKYRSTTEIDELNELDQKAIEEVRGMMTLYKDVALADFPDA